MKKPPFKSAPLVELALSLTVPLYHTRGCACWRCVIRKHALKALRKSGWRKVT